jgi:hypothetical protein
MRPSSQWLQAVIRVLLEAGGFTPEHEAAEASDLWTAVQQESPRIHAGFDEEWFVGLLNRAHPTRATELWPSRCADLRPRVLAQLTPRATCERLARRRNRHSLRPAARAGAVGVVAHHDAAAASSHPAMSAGARQFRDTFRAGQTRGSILSRRRALRSPDAAIPFWNTRTGQLGETPRPHWDRM